jgi:alpha-ketoglutarate-dependent taurine dioxygenase
MSAKGSGSGAHGRRRRPLPERSPAERITGDRLVRAIIPDEGPLPIAVEARSADLDLGDWLDAHREWVDSTLLSVGAVLFRGFAVRTAAEFERTVRTYTPLLSDYVDPHTPRSRVSGAIYTSTEYSSRHSIELHSENSYSEQWPLHAWFWCEHPAARGGRTPLADNRSVLARVPADLRERFVARKVMYVRNYGHGVSLPWQRVFGTSDRKAVERRCHALRLDFEWIGDDRLRTRYVADALALHPRTGDAVWFNQAHAFHPSSLSAEVRASLLEAFDHAELPNDARFGNGSEIESEAIEAVRHAYACESVRFSWRAGDVLLLDNMLIAHGREPYEGSRSIRVALADPVRRSLPA